MTRPPLSAADLLELYAILGRDVADHEDAHGALEAITSVAVQAIPGAQLASITRVSGQQYTTAAPTDPQASVADSLQYAGNSGPCLDALNLNTLIITGNTRADPRWPEWGPTVADSVGLNSVLAVRLVVEEDEMLAALNLYSRDYDAFTQDSLTTAILLATHGALAITRVIARERTTSLTKAVTTNREIGMAMGVLMATHKITEDQAFDLLRIASQETHRKVRDIARTVIDTGTVNLPDRLRRTPGRNRTK